MAGLHVRWSVERTLKFQSRMDNFLDFHYPASMPYLKHSCQDKRLIKEIVLTDGTFIYQIGNPPKILEGGRQRW